MVKMALLTTFSIAQIHWVGHIKHALYSLGKRLTLSDTCQNWCGIRGQLVVSLNVAASGLALSPDCCAVWCPLCLGCRVARAVNEHCCVINFLPGGLMATRAKVRFMYGIQVSICGVNSEWYNKECKLWQSLIEVNELVLVSESG